MGYTVYVRNAGHKYFTMQITPLSNIPIHRIHDSMVELVEVLIKHMDINAARVRYIGPGGSATRSWLAALIFRQRHAFYILEIMGLDSTAVDPPEPSFNRQ